MEENSYIPFEKSFFGPSDLEWLLNVWPENLVPMTPAQIASWFLSAKFEREKGYLPYDRTRIYTTRDKIIIRINDVLRPAKIIKVTENAGHDEDGFTYGAIELELLDFQLGDEERTRKYIADYHGQQYAGHQTEEREAIGKEEKERVESQVLLVISDDDRLVSFENQYFPVELLVNLELKASESLLLIAKEKKPLSSAELLEKLAIRYKTGQKERWRFSLNYYLDRNGRFEYHHDSKQIYWDIHKPGLPLVAAYDKQTHKEGIHVSAELENLLYYHGFTEDCEVCLEGQELITASYDSLDSQLRSEELIEAIDVLLPRNQCHLLIEDSAVRGGPILLNSREFIKTKTIHSTVTIKKDWIEQQFLKIPNRISKYMQDVTEVIVFSNRDEQRLPHDVNESIIRGIGSFYEKKAIAEGDKIRLQLVTTKPEKMLVSMWWRHSLSELMQLHPEDFKWERASVRDCIIVTLGHTEEPMHYREIYAEVSRHKTVSLQSIVNTLSKYSPSVFVHTVRGKWGLALSEDFTKIHPLDGSVPSPVHVSEIVWKAISSIEEKDRVYELLVKVARPLTYNEIIGYLAKAMEIDPKQLAMTDFFDPKDDRFKQLDDGTWALSEWIDKEEPKEEKTIEIGKPRIKRYYCVIFLVIICIIFAILLWLFN